MNHWLSPRRRYIAECALFLFAVVILALSPTSRAADEDGLVNLWKQHLSAIDDHEGAIKACRAFATAHANDPLVMVARGLEEWHTLRNGQRLEAIAMWEGDLSLPPSPMNDCARRVAAGWLTRADREQVVTALQAYYRKEVAYPKELHQVTAHPRLKNEPKPPETDRFGKPWSYALTGFEKVKGFADQKYILRSSVLGDLSELNAAEKMTYAAGILATPQRVMTMPDNALAVSFNLGKTSVLSMIGPGTGELHLAFIGARIIVVCDHTHWKILHRP